MSRPTIRLLVGAFSHRIQVTPSELSSIGAPRRDALRPPRQPIANRSCSACRRSRCRWRARRSACAPTATKRSKRSSTWRRPSRTVTPLSTVELPGAARIEPQRGEAHAGFDQAALRGEVALRDLPSLPGGPVEPRQLRRQMCARSATNSSPRVLSRPSSPQRAAATCSTISMPMRVAASCAARARGRPRAAASTARCGPRRGRR